MNKIVLIFVFFFLWNNCISQTRLYPGTETHSLSPAFNAGWNVTTGATRYKMTMSERGAGLSNRTTSAVGAAAVRKVLADQWIGPAMKAQTVTGTFTGQMKFNISSTSSSTGQGFAYLRVCNSSGTITQEVGTLTTTNLTTTNTNRTLISLNVGTLTISDGDCFVVDIGGNYSVGTNTTRTFTINKGNDRTTDLAVANTGTGAEDPWFEFSDTIYFKGNLWYMSESGNDGNAGTIGSPFRNIQKFGDVADAGDTCYMRGGTITPTTAASLYAHCSLDYLKGNSVSRVYIMNYPAETPIYDFTSLGRPTNNALAVRLDNCKYLVFKGLDIKSLLQSAEGTQISAGMSVENSSYIKVEQVHTYDIGGYGHRIGNSDSVHYKNCDAYDCIDSLSSSDPYGGADGFNGASETSTNTYYEGCRAWHISDDGFDFFNTDGKRTLKNCWAFWNGFHPNTFTAAGNGNGFKLGPTATDKSTDTLKFVYECLAFKNRAHGFDQNNGQNLFKMYNTTSYDNGYNGYHFPYYNSIVQDFKNNCGYANDTSNIDDAGSNVPLTYNSWNGTITVSDADFLSVSSTGMDGARGSDGSLPVLNFMKLASGSDLINAGSDVGFGNDVNWFQFSGRRTKGRIFIKR